MLTLKLAGKTMNMSDEFYPGVAILSAIFKLALWQLFVPLSVCIDLYCYSGTKSPEHLARQNYSPL